MKKAKWHSGGVIVLFLLVVLFSINSRTHGQTVPYSFYQVHQGFSPAMDVNDDGTVVGWWFGVPEDPLTTSRGYIWTRDMGAQAIITDPATINQFPIYTAVNDPARSLRINADGTVAGTGCLQGCSAFSERAALWNANEGLVFLGSFNNDTQPSFAAGINDAGQVVGFSWGGGYNASGPFLWSQAHGFQHLAGFSGLYGNATDINNNGLVVGGRGAGARYMAFVWSAAGGQTDIPDVPGAAFSNGFAVNDSGVVVGHYLEADWATYRVFRWSALSGTEDLNAPAGFVELLDINNAGDVVATILHDGRGRVPYLYRGGQWIDLNQVMPSGTGFTLQFATAINNKGWIVGQGTTDPNGTELGQGFVLIPPASEPPTDDPPLFEFGGFSSPVAGVPAVNLAKAGARVAVNFSLGGDHGLNVLASGSPSSQPMECLGGSTGTAEAAATAGNSGLNYDPDTGLYTYVWRTEKSWSGTCRQFVLSLQDGSSHLAYFRFK